MPRLLIVIGSTRPGRAGLAFGDWFADRARAHGGFDVEVADLAALDLPFLDEPHHPKLGTYTKPDTLAWSAQVDAADAFVLVTPEYNHGYPAVLKNALDYLDREWQHKPVAFVSYGGVAAGTRAVQQLKQVVLALRMRPIVEAVSIPVYANFLDEEVVVASEVMDQAMRAMLDGLAAAIAPSVNPPSRSG